MVSRQRVEICELRWYPGGFKTTLVLVGALIFFSLTSSVAVGGVSTTSPSPQLTCGFCRSNPLYTRAVGDEGERKKERGTGGEAVKVLFLTDGHFGEQTSLDKSALHSLREILKTEQTTDFVVYGGDVVTQNQDTTGQNGCVVKAIHQETGETKKSAMTGCFLASLTDALTPFSSSVSPPLLPNFDNNAKGEEKDVIPFVAILGNHDDGDLLTKENLLDLLASPALASRGSCSCGNTAPFLSVVPILGAGRRGKRRPRDESTLGMKKRLLVGSQQGAVGDEEIPVVQLLSFDTVTRYSWYWNSPMFYEGYESVSMEQVTALKEFLASPEQRAARAKGMARVLFVHVPLPRMMRMLNGWGTLEERICCQPPEQPAVESLEQLLFPPKDRHSGQKTAPVDAVFFGHDHLNDGFGVDTVSGVCLGYGRKSGQGNYPSSNKLSVGGRVLSFVVGGVEAALGPDDETANAKEKRSIRTPIIGGRGRKEDETKDEYPLGATEIFRTNGTEFSVSMRTWLTISSPHKGPQRVVQKRTRWTRSPQLRCCGLQDHRTKVLLIGVSVVVLLALLRLQWALLLRSRAKRRVGLSKR